MHLFFCYKHYLWKKYFNLKTKKKSKFSDTVKKKKKKNYLTVSWPNFSQIGSQVAGLESKMYPQLALFFNLRKRGKDFWRRITRDEIITAYNTKAVDVDLYQRRDNNRPFFKTAGKVKNETLQQMNNIYFKGSALFNPFCCWESIISYLQWIVFIFAPARLVEPSALLLNTFSKSLTLPWKNRLQTAS